MYGQCPFIQTMAVYTGELQLVYVLKCCFKCSSHENVFKHWMHDYVFSPVCIPMCFFLKWCIDIDYTFITRKRFFTYVQFVHSHMNISCSCGGQHLETIIITRIRMSVKYPPPHKTIIDMELAPLNSCLSFYTSSHVW